MIGVEVITEEIVMTKLNRKREVVDKINIEFTTIEGIDTYYAPNSNTGQKFSPNSIGQWIYIDNKKWYRDSTINYELIREPMVDVKP